MPRLANIGNCTGCLACVDTCTKGALVYTYNNEGHLSYEINEDKCIECGLCERVCPVVSAYQYGNNTLRESIPFAAWCIDRELRAKSTSGGIFAALARKIIIDGGVVVGATLLHNDIRHIVIEKEEDIVKLQGSKYAQSNTNGIYRKVKEFLREGRSVLFSGLGCQIAGLLMFLGNKKFSGKLYTLDLICGGVPSVFLIDKYLNEYPDVEEIKSFRNKTKYEFLVKMKGGKERVVPISERPLPLCGFYTELTNRYSCYDCHFNGAHRKSDITIGDYWGDTQYVEQHKMGLSVAVVHSEKGKELLVHSDIEIKHIEWRNFLLHNPRMIDGYKRKAKSKARKNMAQAFKNYPYEKILQIYANKATWREPVVMVKKIGRHIIGKLKGKIYMLQLEKEILRLIGQ